MTSTQEATNWTVGSTLVKKITNMRLLVVLVVMLIIWTCQTKQAESPIKYTLQTLVSTGIDNAAGLHMYNNEIYFVNQYKHVVQKRSAAGVVSVVAGKLDLSGSTGDGSAATSAKLNLPYGVHVFNDKVYIADQYNCKIRLVSSGVITTLAGSGTCAYAEGAAAVAQFANPPSIFVVSDTLYYIADFYNHRIRKVESGMTSSIAGTTNSGYNGDGISATSAQLNEPHNVFVRNNKIYIVDKKNNRIRMINNVDGKIYTVAGNGTLGIGADGVLATSSSLNNPVFVYVTQDEVIYISDHENNKIRRVKNGYITTIAGDGTQGNSVDGGFAHLSSLNLPAGLFVNETNGQIIFTDRGSNRLRILYPTCDSGYNLNSNGSLCLTSFCGGLESTNFASVCSGRGKCTGTNLCECNEPTKYGGSNCELPKCSGILKGESNVCNGRGNCIAVDTCTCTNSSSWGGSNCEKPICNGIVQGTAGECSNRGNCIGPDSCSCTEPIKYTGSDCQYPKCYGIASNDPTVCNANGTCNGVNICSCNSNYDGTSCQYPKCNGISSSDLNVCNKNGACISPNVCVCNSNYDGPFCQYPKCNGISSSDPNVCNRNGTCTSPNVCACNSNYDGTFCQYPKCNGISSSDPNVCSKNGTCTSPNVCVCNSNYYGPFCQYPKCNGTSSSDPNVCNRNGTCTSPNVCACNSNYTGQFCEYPKCNGIGSNDPNVCSKNGSCIAVETCSCSASYTGQFCQYPKCNGYGSNDPNACNRNGTCTGINICSCNSNYTGQYCQYPRCNGTGSNDGSVCSGHGSCASPNVCICNSNYTGTYCQFPKCNGIGSNSGSVCNGKGVCTGIDVCACNSNYDGPFCQYPKCNGISSSDPNVCNRNGTCTSPNVCACNSNYDGTFCQYPKCNGISSSDPNVCSKNGACISPNVCVCNSNYDGPFCQYPKCNGISSSDPNVCNRNGTCTSPNVCACNSNYSGLFCDLPRCGSYFKGDPLVCNSRGSCDSIDNCKCTEASNWGGYLCQTPKCNNTLATTGTVCSSRGTCTSPNVCLCSDTNSYGGSFCEKLKCYGILQGESNVCSRNGSCVGINQCSCNTGYGGNQCEFPICNGILANQTNVCSGHGTCIGVDVCKCNSTYTDNFCQTPVCFGVKSTNASVCSGNGNCSAPDQCNCFSNYFSSNCSQWNCYGIPMNSPQVCSGRGSCQAPDNCSTCLNGYFGSNCENTTCYGIPNNSSKVCSGNGKCQEFNQCVCKDSFVGDICQYPACFGILSNSTTACSGHGNCTGSNQCNCSSNYYSNDCSQWNCYGIPMNSPQVCSGRGSCQAPDNCSTCLNGYFGSNCENTTCYGITYNDTQACSGNGKCTDFNNCVCKFGYVGEACQYPTCFGMPSNSTTACSGNGNCTDVNSCKCKDGFTGMSCFKHSCFGVIAENSSVCSGHGDCLVLNICSCNEGFFGNNCEYQVEERSMESIGKPKGLVKGKIQTLDMNVISAHFKLSDFKSINLANNCTNCTWTNLKYSWQLTDGYQFISSEPQYLLAYYHGKVTDGLYKLSFKPLLSLKGIIPSTLQEKVTLSVKFHNSQNDLDSVEFTESIPLLSSPKRVKSNATITPELGMALSTLFTIEEDPNNWDIPDILLGKLEFSFAFEYVNSFGENILVRMNEFSKSGNASVYLPYLPNNQTKLNSVQIFVICRDDLSYEYSESIGHVPVLPNTEDPIVLITRIKNDHKLGVVVPYDQSENQNSDVLYESVKTISIQVENPSQTLSVINQLTFANSLETKLAVIVSSKLETYLNEVNQILVNEKISNGYLFKQRMSENDLKNTLSTASNILSQGFVNVSSICSQLSSIILNQQTTKVYSDSIESNSYVSNMINITTSSFIKTLNNENITEKFKEITLNTDSILSKYDGYYKEIGLSLITFNEKLYENGNSTQLGNTKEFTIYKSGSPLPLSDLNDPIYITFTISTNSSITNATLSCQFWNETTHQWEKDGCSIFNFNNETNQLTCQCNHTTLFAAFVEQQTLPSTEYLKQVSSLYAAQISFGSLFLILSLIVLTLLIVFRKSQPVSSRYITPYFGMVALIIECAMLLITQRSILLGYANSVLGIQNEFENSQSSVLQLQNGDLAANIISNIFTIIVNTMTLTAIFSYLYQVLRFQMLKYFYHQISIRFNSKEPKSETLLKTTKLFLSTRVMLIVMSIFVVLNVLYWTLWVILIRSGAITGQTYTYIVSISFTCSILLLGFIICCMIAVDWVMTFISNRKEKEIIEHGQEKQEEISNINSTTKLNFSLNDLITGKSLEKLQKFDNLKSAKKVIKVPLQGIYENFVRLDSPLYFRAEMCLFVICFTFLVISQIIGLSGLSHSKADSLKTLLLNDSISLLFDILYMFTYLFVFGGYSLLVLLVHKIKKKQQNEGEEMIKLLSHTEGLKLFEWFCEKEYSLENLQLYLEIKKQRNIFESLDDSQQVKTSINHIYVTYIKNGALKEVNIPSDCSKSFTTLVKKLESSDSNTVSDIELESLRSIGKKKNELPQDLKESIKNLIESLQNQVLFNLSDTFSRFIFSQQYETYQEIVNNKEAFMKQANFE